MILVTLLLLNDSLVVESHVGLRPGDGLFRFGLDVNYSVQRVHFVRLVVDQSCDPAVLLRAYIQLDLR